MLVAGPLRCFRLIQAMDKSNVGDTLPRLRWSLDLPGTDAGRQRKHGYVQFHSFPDLPTLLRCRRLSVCCCCSLSTSYFPPPRDSWTSCCCNLWSLAMDRGHNRVCAARHQRPPQKPWYVSSKTISGEHLYFVCRGY
jgi:hypothetical protein